MKISKVDHMKTCVSIRKSPSGAGILYKHPTPGKADIDVKSHITYTLNRSAKRLYSLFVPCDSKDRQERIAFHAEKRFFDTWAKKYMLKEERAYEPFFKKEQKSDIKNYRSKDAVSSFINGWLRNSLRRNIKSDNGERIYIPEVLTEIMYLAIAGKKEEEIRQAVKEDIYDKVAAFVKEDYTKEERIKKISKSINRKNTKVQVAHKNGKTVLQLSNAKHENKKYIFEFMKEYAASEEEHQRQMLIHIRKLIIAFFCGEDAYNNADVLEWSFGNIEELDESKHFSAEAMELINQSASIPKQEKAEKRKSSDELKHKIRDEIASHYHSAIEIPAIKENEADLFWIQYFEQFAEKELHVQGSLHPGKLSVRALCNTAWKEWVSFIGMKYVDMGKAVYHFAMPSLDTVAGEKGLKIGAVKDTFQKGISSFDYERITAKESLERELSRYIAFSVNTFSKTVCSEEFRAQKNREDLLQVKTPELLPDVSRKLLQYFGGASAWKENEKIANYTDMEFYCAFREKLADLRNATFHYTGKINSASMENHGVISDLLKYEISQVGKVYRKKYYSNNTLMFYKEGKITAFMDYLYHKEYKEVPAYVPGFQNIVNKANLDEVIFKLIQAGDSPVGQGDEITTYFKGAFYFILKEIYYHDFLLLKDLPTRFEKALSGAVENEQARDNFKKRLNAINYTKLSFGEICQYIMMDYNQQNNEKEKHVSAKEKTIMKNGKKVTTAKAVEDTEQKYKHFRTLLYIGIKNAFLQYLKEDAKQVFHFLYKPEYNAAIYESVSEDAFCLGWNCPMYDDFKECNDPLLQSYYVCAHFLNPKYLNHMAGGIKSYIQFRKDIDRRAESTNHTRENSSEEISRYETIIKMLEFCLLFSGQISHERSDYFDTEEGYTAYMGKWIQYEDTAGYDVNPLKAFCEKEAGTKNKRKIGTYYDEKNPILNRNIVMAKLYGDTKTISACFNKITKADFNSYYAEAEALEKVFLRGYCETEEEQKRLRKYQNLKNRIEMVDILVYSELVNDLLGQLISWAYLRERDLMYLQIGYYYTKLYHTDSVPETHWMRQLQGDAVDIIDGAILYQIAAMYTYELPVYELKDNIAYAPDNSASTGANISRFLNKYCQGAERAEREGIYLAGLCFFENIKKHDELAALRNYIDHFKYFIQNDQSILELYSKLYDSFLAYDTKLKKSVTYVLKDILLQYFVDAKLTMSKTSNGSYHSADIRITEDALHSDYFTYKIGRADEKKKVLVKVREEQFVEQLRGILMYKK